MLIGLYVVLSCTLQSNTSILYLSCDRQLLNGTTYGREILHADACPMPGHGLDKMSLRRRLVF